MKGFTLIEILAVIVILSIILIISVPIITSVVEGVKRGAFESSAKIIVETAKTEYVRTSLGKKVIYKDGISSDSDFEYNGKKTENGVIIVDSNGDIKLAIHDGTYCATKSKTGDIEVSKIPLSECKIPVSYASVKSMESESLLISDEGELFVSYPLLFDSNEISGDGSGDGYDDFMLRRLLVNLFEISGRYLKTKYEAIDAPIIKTQADIDNLLKSKILQYVYLISMSSPMMDYDQFNYLDVDNFINEDPERLANDELYKSFVEEAVKMMSSNDNEVSFKLLLSKTFPKNVLLSAPEEIDKFIEMLSNGEDNEFMHGRFFIQLYNCFFKEEIVYPFVESSVYMEDNYTEEQKIESAKKAKQILFEMFPVDETYNLLTYDDFAIAYSKYSNLLKKSSNGDGMMDLTLEEAISAIYNNKIDFITAIKNGTLGMVISEDELVEPNTNEFKQFKEAFLETYNLYQINEGFGYYKLTTVTKPLDIVDVKKIEDMREFESLGAPQMFMLTNSGKLYLGSYGRNSFKFDLISSISNVKDFSSKNKVSFNEPNPNVGFRNSIAYLTYDKELYMYDGFDSYKISGNNLIESFELSEDYIFMKDSSGKTLYTHLYTTDRKNVLLKELITPKKIKSINLFSTEYISEQDIPNYSFGMLSYDDNTTSSLFSVNSELVVSPSTINNLLGSVSYAEMGYDLSERHYINANLIFTSDNVYAKGTDIPLLSPLGFAPDFVKLFPSNFKAKEIKIGRFGEYIIINDNKELFYGGIDYLPQFKFPSTVIDGGSYSRKIVPGFLPTNIKNVKLADADGSLVIVDEKNNVSGFYNTLYWGMPNPNE